MVNMKICMKCKKIKSLNEFGKKTKHKDGLQYACKECSNTERTKRRTEQDGKKGKEINAKIRNKRAKETTIEKEIRLKKRRERDKERRSKYSKEKKQEKLIKKVKSNKNWFNSKSEEEKIIYKTEQKNKSKNKRDARTIEERNKFNTLKRLESKEWRNNRTEEKTKKDRENRNARDKDPIKKEKKNKQRKKRYNEDLIFKLGICLRGRVYQAVKNNQKVGSAVDDLGCSIEEFKKHIEDQFESWMNWDNWGPYNKDNKTWHLDHIKALVKFDLTDRDEFLKAANYTNMRPLLAKENLEKNSK